MGNSFVTLFDTALGRCGIAWDERGILATSFADESDDQTRARLFRRAQGAAEESSTPNHVDKTIVEIRKLFQGATADFDDVLLVLDGLPMFDCEVLNLTSKIQQGNTKTYGELARQLGDVAYSRRVGQALGRNPFPIIVPCHRVVGADGAMTGFSAPGGTNSKLRLLKIEGALEPDLFD